MYTQADENPALPSTEIDKRNELYVAQLYTHADEDLALPSTKIDESREVYTPQVFRADKKTALPSPKINKRNELYNAQVYTQADENRALPITGLDSGDKKEVRDSNISRPMNPFSNKYKTAEGDLSSRATESNTLVDAVAKRDDGFVYKSSVVHNVDGAKWEEEERKNS